MQFFQVIMYPITYVFSACSNEIEMNAKANFLNTKRRVKYTSLLNGHLFGIFGKVFEYITYESVFHTDRNFSIQNNII